MTKAELIESIAKKMGTSKAAADMALKAVCASIGQGLAQWEDVRIQGFGTFKPVLRDARIGRNPKTGEAIRIQPKKAIKFKASKKL